MKSLNLVLLPLLVVACTSAPPALQTGPDAERTFDGLVRVDLDIVSFVPPDMIGRNEIYLSLVGQATLVVEGIDSISGEVVFRAVDRRSANTNRAIRANPVTTWSEVRRRARRWATMLREGLESLHASG